MVEPWLFVMTACDMLAFLFDLFDLSFINVLLEDLSDSASSFGCVGLGQQNE